MTGVISRLTTLSQKTLVPKPIARICNTLFGQLLSSPKPNDLSRPIGATLEIQRQQQVELLEQQMAWSQLHNRRRGVSKSKSAFNIPSYYYYFSDKKNGFGLGALFQNNFAEEPPRPGVFAIF
jgi:hypothetical protein